MISLYVYMYIIYQITVFILVPSMMFEQCVFVLYTWCIGHIDYLWYKTVYAINWPN